jgi:hypothetical protein
MAAGHDINLPRVAGCFAAESDLGAHALYRRHGYEAVRWFFHMIRDLADPIVGPPLPEGIEVRPVTREDARRLFEADVEAFMDHWGGFDHSEGQFNKWVDESTFDPSLHVVAFDGDEIAGAVINTIYPEANQELGVERGWLDSVFVRRPWRRRGLAKASWPGAGPSSASAAWPRASRAWMPTIQPAPWVRVERFRDGEVHGLSPPFEVD